MGLGPGKQGQEIKTQREAVRGQEKTRSCFPKGREQGLFHVSHSLWTDPYNHTRRYHVSLLRTAPHEGKQSGTFCRRVGSYTLFQRLYSLFYCRSSVSLLRRPLPPILAAGHPLKVSQLLWDVLRVSAHFLLCRPLLVMFASFTSWPLPVLSTVSCVPPPSIGGSSWQWVLAGAPGARFGAPAAATPGRVPELDLVQ